MIQIIIILPHVIPRSKQNAPTPTRVVRNIARFDLRWTRTLHAQATNSIKSKSTALFGLFWTP